jgi:hypothetical protein
VTYLETLKAIERCLTLCSSPHADEFEGLREAYLAQRDNNHKPPERQLSLLAAQESRGTNP